MDKIAIIGTDLETISLEKALGEAGFRVQRGGGDCPGVLDAIEFEAADAPSQAQQLALLKARMAASRSGLRYGVAVSGFRDLDPFVRTLPWVSVTIAWWDSTRGYALFESRGRSQPIGFRKLVSDWEGARAAALQLGFPRQAMAVGAPADRAFRSGIVDPAELRIAVDAALSAGDETWISLDPGADCSPGRGRLIEDVATTLASRLKTRCGICRAVGLSEIRAAGSTSRQLCHQCGALRSKRPPRAKPAERRNRNRARLADDFRAGAP